VSTPSDRLPPVEFPVGLFEEDLERFPLTAELIASLSRQEPLPGARWDALVDGSDRP
jgi:hypothetical protein